MTALRTRRKRRTVFGGLAAMVLMIGAMALVLIGVLTLRDSEEGETVGVDDRLGEAFPQTPTMFAIRTDQYKFIQYYGIWDADELYDLRNDPIERHNLFYEEAYQGAVQRMRDQLHALMRETGFAALPLRFKQWGGLNLRLRDGAQPAGFPPPFIRQKNHQQ